MPSRPRLSTLVRNYGNVFVLTDAHHGTRIHTDFTDQHGAAQLQLERLRFGVQPLGCATQRRLKPVLQTSISRRQVLIRENPQNLCESVSHIGLHVNMFVTVFMESST